MKKILLLLIIPFLSFADFDRKEKKVYDKRLSIYELQRDLEKASQSGERYVYENCTFYVNHQTDSVLNKTITSFFGFEYSAPVLDGDLIGEKTKFSIEFINCDFTNGKTVFKNWEFDQITIEYQNGEDIKCDVEFDNIMAKNMHFIYDSVQFQDASIKVLNSKISNIYYNGVYKDLNERWDFFSGGADVFVVKNNEIVNIDISNCRMAIVDNNTLVKLTSADVVGELFFNKNAIHRNFQSDAGLNQMSKDTFQLAYSGSVVITSRMNTFKSSHNRFYDISSVLTIDSLVSMLKTTGFSARRFSNKMDTSLTFNTTYFQAWFDSTKTRDDLGLEPKEVMVLDSIIATNEDVKIIYYPNHNYRTSDAEIKYLSFISDTVSNLIIQQNSVLNQLTLQNLQIDSSFVFENNSLPSYNRVLIDEGILNLGFNYNEKIHHGTEDYNDVQHLLMQDKYLDKTQSLISQYRQIIGICSVNGYAFKTAAVYKLKDLETTQKSYEYYTNPTLNNWFNWRGNQFLKEYSDYGQNPFKALSFCFWTMLYFASFYFFFYSDWDKIDRRFLIRRFNTAVDYFSSEKRIEDFYAEDHQKEITTFNDFKSTLDKYKIDIPPMLTSVARPIYQLSLVRYKILHFLYKRAEFMAGRKWIDLEINEKYAIGLLTFFLMIFYVTYLIIIRALNSIILSINAFSTLGFGQIPVRGLTKYLTIIEGFIGWFLLSVFIVSLLNQMMSI